LQDFSGEETANQIPVSAFLIEQRKGQRMADIPRLLERVRSGKYDETELLNLFKNASKSTAVSDNERASILELVETELRKNYPRVANRHLGAIDKQAREYLESVYQEISAEFDLSGNKIKNGVKTGAAVLAGDAVIDVYISYKNDQGIGAVLAAYQPSIEEPISYQVFMYKGAKKPDNLVNMQEYANADDEVVGSFRKVLSNEMQLPKAA